MPFCRYGKDMVISMSAIWGVITLDDKNKIPLTVKECFETVYKEACNIERYENISTSRAYIGCGIQYITEESKREELPIYDKEQGIIFAADCILDNRKEVQEVLTAYGYDGNVLEEEPDGKLMYYSYLCMGKECTRIFRGLYAIVIWNEKKRNLTLISDHVAARCLYYIKRENMIVFSTLLEPIIQFFPNMEQNTDYYKDFLLANSSVIYVVPGETPYKEVALMLPASVVEFVGKEKKTYTYWTMEDAKLDEGEKIEKTARKQENKFMAVYNACVSDAMRTSGEVGIAMSSGLDSSSIGVLAAKLLANKGKALHSYTFVPYNHFKNTIVGNSVFDESELVQQIADMYPNIESTFLNNNGKNIFEDMDFITKLLEMPYKTGTFSNHYEMCSEGAKVGCKVFLNGGFGNNTVSYGEIMHVLYELYRKKRIGRMLFYANRYCKHENVSRRKMIRMICHKFRAYEEQYTKRLEHFVPDNVYLIPSILKGYDLKERFSRDRRTLISEGYIDREKYKEHLKATSLLIYLGVFETKFGLSTGMLLRDPTKDIRILSFCNQLPYHIFAYRGMTRWLVRKSFEDLLPKEILRKWKQKGLLNADWLMLIYRDWEKIKPELFNNISMEIFDDWIDKKRLQNSIEQFGIDKKEDEKWINYLCAIEGLRRFIKLQKNSNKDVIFVYNKIGK